MTHLSDFAQLLEYHFTNSQFKLQKTLPLFPLVSPNTIKGSVSKVEKGGGGAGYHSEFFRVYANTHLTEFDSRYRSLDLTKIDDVPRLYTRVYTGGSYIETEFTTTAYYSSNTRIIFNFAIKKVRTGRFTSDKGDAKYMWMDQLPEIPIAVGVNEMTIPATGGIWWALPQFGGTSNSATLTNFEIDDLVLDDPPYFVQMLEEKVLENLEFYEYIFEVRYALR